MRGHTLVFLPGAGEIRACLKGCEALTARRSLSLRPLHGELSPEAQAFALAPSDAPKVILSTNVAESSVTLDGIAAVVDSGLGREAAHSPWLSTSERRHERSIRLCGGGGAPTPRQASPVPPGAGAGYRHAGSCRQGHRQDGAGPIPPPLA